MITLLLASWVASAQFKFVFVPDCVGKGSCGPQLIESGWKQIATCSNDREWHYVIEKKKKRQYCQGRNAGKGPQDQPCVPYSGDIIQFKKCTILKDP